MINDDLRLSARGIQLLKDIEDFRAQPYDDQTGRTISQWCAGATIGYGHLIAKQHWDAYKDGISEADAARLLVDGLVSRETTVQRAIIVPLKPHQFDALVLLAYNIGNSAFKGSSVVKLINDPRRITRYPTLETAWKAWKRSQGQVNNGLVNRRACEWRLYSKGIYARW